MYECMSMAVCHKSIKYNLSCVLVTTYSVIH